MSTYEALIQEGEEKGIKKTTVEHVLGMHKEGIAIKKIARVTKLSESEVKKIINEKSKK